MSAPLISMVLMRAPITFGADSVARALKGFPEDANLSVKGISEDGETVVLDVDGTAMSVVSIAAAIPETDFAKALAGPGADDLRPLVAAQGGHLIVICKDGGAQMGDAVFRASVVHNLAARFGALGKPLGGFWVSSERLSDWQTFTRDAESCVGALTEDGGAVAFPNRYWVSVQLTQDKAAYGGITQGLVPFTGYELDLRPLDWPLEAVAQRMVGTTDYLFQNGPVLEDGQSLGVSDSEIFRIALDKDRRRLSLTLESTGAESDAP